ncbi:MAG: hypothetical protein JRI36_03700 [Deltaproteobacteria bacterium]|nr:hypothetical protein [Deltaproteobacteria bacterium]
MLNEKNITALLAVFFMIFVMGFLLHQSPTFAGSLVGHLLGIFGTAVISMTLVYPFRKRVLKQRGKKNPITPHIYYGLIGPTLVVVHSAHKFSSAIGVLVFLSMFIVVGSGIVGKFLFRRVNRTIRQQESDLEALKNLFALSRADALTCRNYTALEQNSGPVPGRVIDIEGQQRCEVLLSLAKSIAELEQSVRLFSHTKTLFSRWIRVHYLLTFFLFAMVIVHVLTSFYYGLRWLR